MDKMVAQTRKAEIMQYNIVYDDVLDSLIEKVNQAIQEGWNPVGGLVIANDQLTESGNLFLQSITR